MDQANTKPYHLPEDAVWFITGCSSGIGLALAQLIAQTGRQRVVATARKVEAMSELADGPNVHKMALDVTAGSAAVAAAVEAAAARFGGRLDVVVNNAGYGLMGDTEATSDADARAQLDTNFWGAVDVVKRALGVMRDDNPRAAGGRRGGVILNVSSMGGFIGYPGQAFYHASKFALEGFTESVAKELPLDWNIHLCSIEPGGVKTKYATSSLKLAARHPAYADPSSPTNMLLAYMKNDESRETWAPVEDVAMAMYHIVSRGQKIPIRLPLGPDAWGAIVQDLDKNKELLEELKDLSTGVGNLKQREFLSNIRNLSQ